MQTQILNSPGRTPTPRSAGGPYCTGELMVAATGDLVQVGAVDNQIAAMLAMSMLRDLSRSHPSSRLLRRMRHTKHVRYDGHVLKMCSRIPNCLCIGSFR